MYNFNYNGSKFKLRITNERYFVNEEKRTVTVKASIRMSVPEFIWNKLMFDVIPQGFVPDCCSVWDDQHKSIQMTATARCAPEDVFNVETGKKIALARLEATAYERFVGSLVKWNAEFRGFVDSVNLMTQQFVAKGVGAANHNWRYIENISGMEFVGDEVPEW